MAYENSEKMVYVELHSGRTIRHAKIHDKLIGCMDIDTDEYIF